MQAQRVGTGGSRGAHIWITRGGVVCAGLAVVADLAALWAAFAVKSGEVCGQSGSAAHSTCQPVSLLYAFDSPLARGVLALMVALGFVPLLAVLLQRGWPALVSLALQSILQVLGFGSFWYWLPMWGLTVGVVVLQSLLAQRGGWGGGGGVPSGRL